MKELYKVAGHCFSIEMRDDSPLWARMDNYTPFLVNGNMDMTALPPVFEMTVCEGKPEFKKTPVHIDDCQEEDMPRLDLYHDEQGDWVIEMAPVQKAPICGWLSMSADFCRGKLHIEKPDRLGLFAVNNAAMVMYAFSTAGLKTLEMHSSVVCKDGRAYMFLGKSGTGKSTHSNLWLKYIPGSELMNDDNPIIRVQNDGMVMVYGSPWSGKTRCYRNVEAPVGALVMLRQCKENKIVRQSVIEAYASIFMSCSGYKEDSDMGDELHETIAAVLEKVPCWLLDCLPDEAAAKLSYETIK
jgi:hypothetical protein